MRTQFDRTQYDPYWLATSMLGQAETANQGARVLRDAATRIRGTQRWFPGYGEEAAASLEAYGTRMEVCAQRLRGAAARLTGIHGWTRARQT
jgi:hypothetical protein